MKRTTLGCLLMSAAMLLLPTPADAQLRYGLTEDEYREVDEFREFWNSLPAEERAGVELPETDELIRCALSEGRPCRTTARDQQLFDLLFGQDGVVRDAPATAPQQSQRYLAYGSRGVERVRIVNETGLDTAYAAIEVRPDLESARLHCQGYLNDTSEDCPAKLIAEFNDIRFVGRVTGNCNSGEFTSMFGDRYRFEGRQEPAPGTAEYRLRDLTADEILGPGNASNYPVLIETFEALCPSGLSSAPQRSAGPPPADAVYDTRSGCLYGSMEGEELSEVERAQACDALARLEDEALDAGYCWNQMAAEYTVCEP